MTFNISPQGITRFIEQLDHRILDDAPTTYLPTILPLAFPSPTHAVNFFTTLHLIYDVLVSSQHAAYFFSSKSTARDTAIRGTVSLFLGSEESWDEDNLLSASAWRAGKLDERAIAEHFEIKVVRERQHETMRAIRVGERWNKAAAAAQALVALFAELGDRLAEKCLGEAVQALVQDCSQTASDEPSAFAARFAKQATQLVPSISDSAPLFLLQDLAKRQTDADDLGLSLPACSQLANVSPVPLSVPVLLRFGVVEYNHLDEAARTGIEAVLSGPFDVTSTASVRDASLKVVSLPLDDILDIAKLSIKACTLIRQACHSTGENASDVWKTRLSFQDVWRVCALLEERMTRQGQGFMLVSS